MDPFKNLLHDALLFISLHPLVIKGLTAIAAGFCAVVILYLSQESVSAKRWAKFFGYGFLAYSLGYALQFCLAYAAGQSVISIPIAETMIPFIAITGSIVNNLFFLASASVLIKRKPILPIWAWVLTAISFVGLIDTDIYSWVRLPESVFSAVCLLMIGQALAVNISFRKPYALKIASLIVVSFYSLIQLIYGLNPVLVAFDLPGITREMISFLDGAGKASPLMKLDTFAIGMALPLKFGLFSLALYLLIQAIMVVSPANIKEMLKSVNYENLEYLSNKGIVRSICKSLHADRAELYLMLPGQNNKRIALFKWDRTTSAALDHSQSISEPEIIKLSSLNKEVREKFSDPDKDPHDDSSDGSHTEQEVSGMCTIMARIRFHGAIIGCLKIRWNSIKGHNLAVEEYIREWAELVTPAVQAYREMAALHQFSTEQTKLEIGQLYIDGKEGIEKVTGILYDILSPLAVGVTMDCGFRRYLRYCGQDEGYTSNLKMHLSNEAKRRHTNIDTKTQIGETVLLTRKLITIQDKKDDKVPLSIGELALIVNSGPDLSSCPELGTNDSHRRTIGALVTDSLLDIMREHFSRLLRDFGVKLNEQKKPSESNWFRDVEDSAKKADLLWVVTSQMGTEKLLGNREAIQIVKRLPEHEEPEVEKPVSVPVGSSMDNARCVIVLILPETKTKMWLGVRRKEFGPELKVASPWKVFLDRFAEIADATLVRFATINEFQRLYTETMQIQGLATVSVTNATVLHQIVNLVRGIASPASTLRDGAKKQILNSDPYWEELILMILESSDNIRKLASQMINIAKVDARRPCSLLEAAQQSETLYSVALTQRDIKLSIDIDKNVIVDVPFTVASLTLANLVDNAKDAIIKKNSHKTRGSILIKARNDGDTVYCEVTDDGPGIPVSLKERIFDLGVSTRDRGGGVGLYLVRRSLIENRGNIEISKSSSDGTTFTIRFPKPR